MRQITRYSDRVQVLEKVSFAHSFKVRFQFGGLRLANLTRRHFIAATLAAGGLRAFPYGASKAKARRILTLVYDKSLGMMRAVERIVP
ncbi:MAG: hypothetical protein AAGK67_14285 [Pseudomonadota bacterium]